MTRIWVLTNGQLCHLNVLVDLVTLFSFFLLLHSGMIVGIKSWIGVRRNPDGDSTHKNYWILWRPQAMCSDQSDVQTTKIAWLLIYVNCFSTVELAAQLGSTILPRKLLRRERIFARHVFDGMA